MQRWKSHEVFTDDDDMVSMFVWTRLFECPKGGNNLYAPTRTEGVVDVIGQVAVVRVAVCLDMNQRRANSEPPYMSIKHDVTWTAVLVLTDGRDFLCSGKDVNHIGAMQGLTRRINMKWRHPGDHPTDFCFDSGVRFNEEKRANAFNISDQSFGVARFADHTVWLCKYLHSDDLWYALCGSVE